MILTKRGTPNWFIGDHTCPKCKSEFSLDSDDWAYVKMDESEEIWIRSIECPHCRKFFEHSRGGWAK